MSITLPEVWRCDECSSVHDHEDDARECCRPHVSEGYVCPVCREFHPDEQGAIACHDWDPDAPPSPPTAAELEAAGQMRLLP